MDVSRYEYRRINQCIRPSCLYLSLFFFFLDLCGFPPWLSVYGPLSVIPFTCVTFVPLCHGRTLGDVGSCHQRFFPLRPAPPIVLIVCVCVYGAHSGLPFSSAHAFARSAFRALSRKLSLPFYTSLRRVEGGTASLPANPISCIPVIKSDVHGSALPPRWKWPGRQSNSTHSFAVVDVASAVTCHWPTSTDTTPSTLLSRGHPLDNEIGFRDMTLGNRQGLDRGAITQQEKKREKRV